MSVQILAGLDSSTRAPAVFDAAAELALKFGATLHLCRALEIPSEFPAAAASTHRDPLAAYLENTALDEFRRMADRAPEVVLGKAIARSGEPWRLILEVGDEIDARLIVIGSHGYRGLDRILGTTAARVVNAAKRNVLVVHTGPMAPIDAPAKRHNGAA